MISIFSIEMKEFFHFCLAGLEISALFDLFRAKRRAIKTSNIVTCIEDILYWTIAGAIILYTIIRYTSGDIRLYMLIGVVTGGCIYYYFLSKFFLKILIKLFNIVLFPIRKLKHFYKLIKKH
ncbi:MAG: hypothetical protein IKE91_07900 [Clostridia bacterium]|nr:hypothetical protein [Clostridia bacterium]